MASGQLFTPAVIVGDDRSYQPRRLFPIRKERDRETCEDRVLYVRFHGSDIQRLGVNGVIIV